KPLRILFLPLPSRDLYSSSSSSIILEITSYDWKVWWAMSDACKITNDINLIPKEFEGKPLFIFDKAGFAYINPARGLPDQRQRVRHLKMLSPCLARIFREGSFLFH